MRQNVDIFWEILVNLVEKVSELPDDINIFVISESSGLIKVLNYDLSAKETDSKIVFRVDDGMELCVFTKEQFTYVNNQKFRGEKDAKMWLGYDAEEIVQGKFKLTRNLYLSRELLKEESKQKE